MTRVLVLLVFLVISLSALAEKVDEASAVKVAVNFYYRQYNIDSDIQYDKIMITGTYIIKAGNIIVFYIFNINHTGYVIVSAYDAAYPVPAYSFESEYLPSWQPPQFTAWVKQYEIRIVNAASEKLQATPEISKKWEELLNIGPASLSVKNNVRSITPMISTHWDQGLFYNDFCPPDNAGPGGYTIAGCVPVAMGQILNYYRWPLQGNGSYSYNDTVYGTISADFGSTFYQWDEMPVSLTTSNTALSKLLFHLGVSVDLNYGPDGSGMTNHKAAYALKTYFGYAPSTQYIFRDSTSIDWKQTVIDHLDAGRPLYYAGWGDTIFQDGHAFVCDGYQDTTWFHFNWGWDGSYDGYFMIDNLTPGSADFTLLHEMIAYMVPDGNYPQYCNGNKVLTSIEGIIDDGSGPLNEYQDNSECSWLIAPNDSLSGIIIDFLKFSLDTGDFVIVYNGENITDSILGIYTGNVLPQTVTSTGNRVLITFVSDTSVTSPGFLISYTSVPVVFCHGTETITESSGVIEDGSGDYNYRNNVYCIWKIQPPGASSFTVNYDYVHLAGSDLLKVFSSNTLLAIISGDTLPPPLTFEGDNMKITFRTNLTGAEQGFKLNYLTESSGESLMETGASCSVFPNPACSYIHVSAGHEMPGNIEIQIFDSSGRLIQTQQTDEKELNISIDQLSDGVYFLRIKHPGSCVVKKIVKT